MVSAHETSHEYLKVFNLIEDLTKTKVVVGIPAPSWAEFIVKTDEATKDAVAIIKGLPNLKVLPFDEVAAHEAALILRGAINSVGKRGASDGTWQRIKFDRQILAISRVHKASKIYTDDEDLIKEANRIGQDTVRSSELTLPQVQTTLEI